jgi:hypothetical protein
VPSYRSPDCPLPQTCHMSRSPGRPAGWQLAEWSRTPEQGTRMVRAPRVAPAGRWRGAHPQHLHHLHRRRWPSSPQRRRWPPPPALPATPADSTVPRPAREGHEPARAFAAVPLFLGRWSIVEEIDRAAGLLTATAPGLLGAGCLRRGVQDRVKPNATSPWSATSRAFASNAAARCASIVSVHSFGAPSPYTPFNT